MTTSYLSVDENGFHSIILKHNFNDFTYLLSLDYTGAQFLGKFSYDEEYSAKGVFSYSYGSQEWEKKISSVMFDESSKYFKVETEDLFEFFNTDDTKIMFKLIDELSKYVYHGYDEDTDTEYENPIIKEIDFDSLKKIKDNHFCSNQWDNEFMELTNSNIWELSLKFPDLLDEYL